MRAWGKPDTLAGAGRPSIFWHCVLIVMLLAVAAGFFYLRHRLIERADREVERVSEVLETAPGKPRLAGNIARWHDSSLIFAAVRDSQAANGGNLPEGWEDELLDSLEIGKSVTTARSQTGLSLPEAEEDEFHVLVGHVCSENPPEGYWENEGELAYAQIIEKSDDSAFAIVYGAEESSSGSAKYIRCLDSLGGFDDPAFIFKEAEL